ncbi:hypothetical protein D041_0110B, partial [Vibrio parahaemolyticus EKP-008]
FVQLVGELGHLRQDR